ncbi:hypothetical protein FNV43_RR23386 [Rhamnella rubrinervis]|uniref:Phytocyanin domain-containing protein n=1 Tax=Rhamnella rubrinervis TaxID=2594499 RepID=A0A8K0DYE8_9ROSA|nr:hypothetical protein FNV43_RR23386 [Rhamnella rubrinervis]
MVVANNTLIFFATLLALWGVCCGAVYKVGDSNGWTSLGSVDYKLWASTKSFHAGDILEFEYNAKYHNVVRVKHREFQSCNATDPISITDTGSDQMTIVKAGHYYFICGVPGHCLAGMKVDIRVGSEEAAPAPSPTAIPPKSDQSNAHPPYTSPPASTPSPSPSPSNAPSLHSSKLHLVDSQLLLAMAILAFLAF